VANTKWHRWSDRNKIVNKNQPAIYFIAHSEKDISGNDFSLIKEIIYIGMSISIRGLKGRLDQFEAAMKGKNGVHGGAERVRVKYEDPEEFFKKAYISAKIFKLSNTRDTANDWRIKGDCVGQEYKSFADYMDRFGCLPEFNDQKRSKKK
jgi:hypothetical protein